MTDTPLSAATMDGDLAKMESHSVEQSAEPQPERTAEEDAVASRVTLKLVLLVTALCLTVFCQALDNTIIATAIPRITDEFDSLDDVGWYGSAYLLATCAFQLSYGKLYNLFPTKWVFLVALGIFELGSLVCGATPGSVGLIMGRVVAGIGSGGIFSGAILIVASAVPLDKRPIYNGLLGAMYAIASIAGPMLGGVFTDRVTWRLCFYINLPFGFVTAVYVLFFLSGQAGPNSRSSLTLREKAKNFDIIGLFFFIPTVVCLLLALEWGGSTYSWKNARIIALFVVSGLSFLVFSGVQFWQKDRATVPSSVVRQRTVWACSFFVFFLFGSFVVITYYIPIWFQAIKGASPIQSGIHNLPSILGTVVLSLVAGVLVSVFGYYTWACILSSILTIVGAALLSTFTATTNSPHWIGYQIIYGAGIGFGLQQPIIAVQTILPDHQISEGVAIIVFVQTLGAAVFVSVAQNVFSNKLVQNIAAEGIPVDPGALLSQGATKISTLVPPQFLDQLRFAYNESITQAFYVAVATAGLSIVGSALIPWFSVKKKDKTGREAAESGAENAGPPEASERRTFV